MRGRAGEFFVLLLLAATLVLILATKVRCARAVGEVFEALDRELVPQRTR